MSEPLTLREALIATTRTFSDVPLEHWDIGMREIHRLAIEVAFKELGLQEHLAAWQEYVALIDEFARLDRLLPDPNFMLAHAPNFPRRGINWTVFADTPDAVRVEGQGRTRLAALRALNDALEARQEVSNLESDR